MGGGGHSTTVNYTRVKYIMNPDQHQILNGLERFVLTKADWMVWKNLQR